MGQNASGLRTILAHPVIYDTLQRIMGADRARRELVARYVRPSPGMRILDVGCGTASILAYLPEDTQYWGYDISAEYLAAARSRFPARGNFHCGPVDTPPPGGPATYDLVLAIGVLHHLDDDLAERLAELARGMLEPAGRLITVDPCLADGQHPVARYLVQRDRGRNVRDSAGYLRIVQRAFATVNGTLRHRGWIPYTNWIMECTA